MAVCEFKAFSSGGLCELKEFLLIEL